MNFENTLWISNIVPGRTHAHMVSNLNNHHIANIINFFKTKDTREHGYTPEESQEIINMMMDVAEKRELTLEFLTGAPYPFDPKKPYVEYGQEQI